MGEGGRIGRVGIGKAVIRYSERRCNSVTVDTEYEGRDGEIKGLLLRFILKWVPDFPKQAIAFRQVGKHSRAHMLAWETYRGKREPDKRITLRELLQYC